MIAIVVLAGFLLILVFMAGMEYRECQLDAAAVKTLKAGEVPSAAYVALHPPNLPDWDAKPILFTDIQVKSIKGVEGWSAVSFKVNDRQYRLDMEDNFAKELGKRFQ